MTAQPWLALAIGNSRLHWGWFDRATLLQAWDTLHLDADGIRRLIQQGFAFGMSATPPQPELWLVSTVPQQMALWQSYPQAHSIALTDIPLDRLYPTLGIDRALCAWGASQQLGLPVLVIDGGTALTLTGVNAEAELVGGAIWPGLRLQWRSLAQGTAALPEIDLPAELPDRWATNTIDAIRSGVLYSTLAGLQGFIAAWQQQFPSSAIGLTGGDGALLAAGLTQLDSALANRLTYQPHLLLHSIAAYRTRKNRSIASTD